MKANMNLHKFFIIITSLALSTILGCGGEVFKNLLEGGGGDKIPPTVVSVMSTAYDKVRVEFSEEVDAITAATISNYNITDLDIVTAEMDANPKVVRLTTDLQFFTTYDITVFSAIEDLKGNVMTADYAGTFEGAVNEPRLVNATAIKVDQILVEFSEPVDTTAASTITYYSISPLLNIGTATHPYSGNNAQVLLTLSAGVEMAQTNYTMEITGSIKDTDNYVIHPLYKIKTFIGDARPRVSQISSISTTRIRVRFTESLTNNSAITTTGNYTITKVSDLSSLGVSSAALDAIDPSVIEIVTSATQDPVSYKIVFSNITDLNGNAVATGTSGFFTGDGPPAIARAESQSPTSILVTFSEPVRDASDETDADTLTAGNYTIAGLSVSAAAWPGGSAGDRTKVLLTTSTQLQQIYTLQLTANVLEDTNNNLLESGYNTASFQGDGLPRVSSAVSVDSTHVKVVFSEPVDITTAQNTNNYSFSPSLTVTGAVRQSDPNSNEVILETSTQLYVNYTVTATNVRDTTNNTISGNNTAQFAGIGTDNAPPNLINAVANGTTNVRLFFNEPVQESSAETTGNYSISNLSTATITVSAPWSAGASEDIVITVPDSVTGTNSITVTAANSENLASHLYHSDASAVRYVAYSIANTINAWSGSPVRAYAKDNKVELISRTFGKNITVTESIANISKTEVTSLTYNPTGAVRSDGNYSQVDLTFVVLASGTWQIKVINVEDENANTNPIVSATKTVLVRSSDTVVPKLAGAYAPDSMHVYLLFDEPLEFISSNKTANYAIEREIAQFNVTGGSKTNDTVTITYDTSSTYILTAVADDTTMGANKFIQGNKAVTMENITNALMSNTGSPVYAHTDGTSIFISRKTIGSGTINNVTDTGGFTAGFSRTAATYANNRTIKGAARNDDLPREVILTLKNDELLATTHDYVITATQVTDFSLSQNTNNGGTQVMLPISSENTSPVADTSAPRIISVTALSDGLIRVIYDEVVDEATAETTSCYSISPSLSVTSAVRDDSNNNVVLLYTELQAALTYTLTVNGVKDSAATANTASSVAATFTGMAAVSPDNGPVGNAISGITTINNVAVTAMAVFNNRLYIATYNDNANRSFSDVFMSDPTGVYFSQVNNSGFTPPAAFNRQDTTTVLVGYNNWLWAATSLSPSSYPLILNTDGTGSPVHNWILEGQGPGKNQYGYLFPFGIGSYTVGAYTTTGHLYYILGNTMGYWDGSGIDNYFATQIGTSPVVMTSFGGRLYVGTNSAAGMQVYRSFGANADFPLNGTDFELVLSASNGQGMDGWDNDDLTGDNHYKDSYNQSVTSMTVFKGYIYIGTYNYDSVGLASRGAQVWRSQDGLTWERVLDFGGSDFGGLNDTDNDRITTMQVNGNFIYVGTRNENDGAEVWRSPDGVTWEQFGSNGFGSTSYTDVRAMASFLGLIYFGMEDADAGGAIFRASN